MAEWRKGEGAVKRVVVCEKPSQARNVRAAVGSRFGEIVAARGHLYELQEPEDVNPQWATWSGDLLHHGKPYELKPRKGTADARKALKAALRGAGEAIVATDCDREGTLIGMDAVRMAGFRGKVSRAIFSAEDPRTIRAAFDDLRPARGVRRAAPGRRGAAPRRTRSSTSRSPEPPLARCSRKAAASSESGA